MARQEDFPAATAATTTEDNSEAPTEELHVKSRTDTTEGDELDPLGSVSGPKLNGVTRLMGKVTRQADRSSEKTKTPGELQSEARKQKVDRERRTLVSAAMAKRGFLAGLKHDARTSTRRHRSQTATH